MTKEEREQLDREVADGLGRMYRCMLDNAVNPPEYAEINDISKDDFCKEVLRQIADAFAENPLEPGLYQIDLNIRKCRMPDKDYRKVYERFNKSSLCKEVYKDKSLGDIMPIEE